MTQPMPTKNDLCDVFDLVRADLDVRARVGMDTYGTVLQPFNGRDPLWDAYEEAIDLVVYLRQAIEEKRLTHRSLYAP